MNGLPAFGSHDCNNYMPSASVTTKNNYQSETNRESVVTTV
jgi:hypothetical protein